MSLLKRLKYYLQSISPILRKTNFWIIPFCLFKKELIFKVKKNQNQFYFYVKSLIDIWVVKEVILDNQYQELRKIKKNDFVIDIGASIGDFSILASKQAREKYSHLR